MPEPGDRVTVLRHKHNGRGWLQEQYGILLSIGKVTCKVQLFSHRGHTWNAQIMPRNIKEFANERTEHDTE